MEEKIVTIIGIIISILGAIILVSVSVNIANYFTPKQNTDTKNCLVIIQT